MKFLLKKDNENGIKFANLFKATNVDLNKIISWIDEEHKAKKIDQEKANERKKQINDPGRRLPARAMSHR